jgi:PBP1b-binding outer membrane lipoprotein LpoB
MKKNSLIGSLIIFVTMALMISGCAVGSHQARNVDAKNSPLVNPDILVEGTGDQALYRYVNPKVDVKQYSKIIIDPVMVQKDGELDEKELQNYQTLANNAYVYLTQELEKDYKIVKSPEPGTFRIQMAIIDADSTKPVRNTLSTIVPIGIGLSVVKYAATGKQVGVGEITVEMKITDVNTGELLGAALDRRVGGKQLKELWSSWNNADDALQYWAKRLAFVLCDMRSGSKCSAP